MAHEIFGLDAPEDIQKCLRCEKTKCNNCLAVSGRITLQPRMRAVFLLDPETKAVVAHYPSISEASRQTNVRPGTIAIYCSQRRLIHGYIWTYTNTKGDDD